MNYHKLKLNELQYLFESEWGTDALKYSIRKGWKKKNYAECFEELIKQQDTLNIEGKDNEEVRKSWAKKNKYMLDKFEKMTII